MSHTRDVRLVKMPESGPDFQPYYDHSWALIIGINQYRDPSSRLANARNDAAAVADLLRNAYRFDHVATLFDEEATKDAILTWLRDTLPARVQSNDRLIIFFAGHGTTRESGSGQRRGYLIPYEADFSRYADFVDMAELRDACGWIPAKHILIILDCCFSGIAAVTARAAVTANPTATLSEAYVRRITERGAWQVLTAGALDELVADSGSRPGHSAFTSALLAGLEGSADQNQDGVITASELAAFVKPEVSRETTLSGGRGQLPFFSYFAGSEQGDFVWIKPGETPRLAATPRAAQTLSRSNPLWLWAALAGAVIIVAALSWFVWSNLRETREVRAALTALIATMTHEATVFSAGQEATLAAVTAAPASTRTAVVATQTSAVVGTRTAVAPILTSAVKGVLPVIERATPTPTFTATARPRLTVRSVTPQLQQPQAQVAATFAPQLDQNIAAQQNITATQLTNPQDCSVVVAVPAGEFPMGPDALAPPQSQIAEGATTIKLADFWISRTEVTLAQYAACVRAGACKLPQDNRLESKYRANPDFPVSDITWAQANDYARWAGGRLPTEAEWEKAACGTGDNLYPWGDQSPDKTLLNFGETGINDMVPVGSYPAGASPYGALDMAGNVWEWTSSMYQPYPYQADDGREDPNGTGDRVLRGGAFDSDASLVLCAARFPVSPDAHNYHAGFRIVFDDPTAFKEMAQCGE